MGEIWKDFTDIGGILYLTMASNAHMADVFDVCFCFEHDEGEFRLIDCVDELCEYNGVDVYYFINYMPYSSVCYSMIYDGEKYSFMHHVMFNTYAPKEQSFALTVGDKDRLDKAINFHYKLWEH